MKIGLLAYSTNTGLGYQTLDFYNNIKPDKVLLVDLKQFNGVETHHERYYQPRICEGMPTNADCEWLVDGMDIVFVCETPLNYYLFEYANRRAVKTVLQYNYEFLDYLQKPNLPKPTVLAAPSRWNIISVENKKIAPVIEWPVPINNEIPFRKIKKVETLTHIIGRPAARDRNGTITFLEMAKMLGKQFKYEVFIQPPKDYRAITHFEAVQKLLVDVEAELYPNLKIIADTPFKEDMYKNGDILVLPRRYGGLCLPMWEALSAGMPVIMPDISPNNSILRKGWLCEARIKESFETRVSLPVYDAYPGSLVQKVEYVSGHIEKFNLEAREIAENMSWEVQEFLYRERFKRICES